MAEIYTTTWPEERVLAAFWALIKSGSDRLDTLLAFSTVVVPRPSDWDRAAVRAESGQHLKVRGCFGCHTRSRRLYWHHVIEVQHGGSNAKGNLLPLCLRCHAKIHPWLDANRPGETFTPWRALTAVMSDVMERAANIEDIPKIVEEADAQR